MGGFTAIRPSGARVKLGLVAGMRTPLVGDQPDEQLVALARHGSADAFESLFRRYRCRLVAFAEHMLGARRSDAEDVVQEVMISASAALVADERPIDVRPWLYQITRNRCLNHLRDQAAGRRPPINGHDDSCLEQVACGQSVPEQAEGRADLRTLVEDLHALPETQRTALTLRELEGLSYQEVADVMGATVPGVKSLLVRARLTLVDIAEARELSCEQVRHALARCEQRLGDLTGPERAHMKSCETCTRVRKRLRATSRGLAALAPIGVLAPMQQMLEPIVKEPATAGIGGAAGTAGIAGAAGIGGGAAAGGLLTAGGVASVMAALAAGVIAVGTIYSPPKRDAASGEAAPAPLTATAPAAGSANGDGSGAASSTETGKESDSDDPTPVVAAAASVEAPASATGGDGAPVVIEEPETTPSGDGDPRGHPGFYTGAADDSRGRPDVESETPAETPADEPAPPPSDDVDGGADPVPESGPGEEPAPEEPVQAESVSSVDP